MKKFLLRILALVLVLAIVLILGRSPLPSLGGRHATSAIQGTADSAIGKATVPIASAHPGLSGIVPLPNGQDAFAARVLLADAAERSLDVQYYIWHPDMSGTLLFDALRRAADRGVRVRILLDDNNTPGMDAVLAALDAHPNMEVRLFNPFVSRRWRQWGYLTDFNRLNRRMHNKSFTADNQVTIIGGRNVGDEYFDAGRETAFIDMDVLAVGAVVADVSTQFDRYWTSESAYPADRVLPKAEASAIAALAGAATAIRRNPEAAAYTRAIQTQPFVRELLANHLALEWVIARMVCDDPAKGLGLATEQSRLAEQLKTLAGPTHEMQLISPYFVPSESGTAWLVELARRGVHISVLTNALEATDVPAVHAGYTRWRKPLLEAGVQLYELKRRSSAATAHHTGLPGSSGSSLHAKTFAVDRRRLFVGSFNFDPRSIRLNTEMGFVLDSPFLAGKVADVFATEVGDGAYRVRLDKDGGLEWTEKDGARELVLNTEPHSGFWRRAWVGLLSLLPIEWLL